MRGDVLSIVIAVLAFAAIYAADRGARPRMSAAELFGLIVSVLVFAYLVYALLRGEKL